VKVKNY